MSDTHDRSSPLLLALSRPAVLWGVPLEGFVLNIMATFFGGIWLSGPTIWRSPFMFWFAGIPIHLLMQRLTAYDYHWVRTIRLWMLTAGAGRNVLRNLPAERPRHGREVGSSV